MYSKVLEKCIVKCYNLHKKGIFIMKLTKENYKPRLIDDKITKYLKFFGAIHIEGPKWCGKTWTALNHSQSVTYMNDQSSKDLALIDPKYVLTKERPALIDEWQIVPSIWDAVRHICDEDSEKGKFILTGSTTLSKDDKEDKKVFHTGTGRIVSMNMYPMSLYESGDSTGDVSIKDMLEDKVEEKYIGKVELPDLARLIIRGGWPENIGNTEDVDIIPNAYLDSMLKKDINEHSDQKRRDANKMRMLIRSLARNESSTVGNKTIIKDIEEYENSDDLLSSTITVADYLSILDDLFLISNQNAFSINYRSSKRVGKSPKRHLVDPSLSCAALNLSVDKLMNDLNTFELMFEALVERDLRIYMDYLDGQLYHFRDNISGDEVDAILEFKDSSYAAVEIKLSEVGIEDAKKSLVKFYENVKRKPKFMCIIVGHYEAIVKDKETGIYILPITSLKP